MLEKLGLYSLDLCFYQIVSFYLLHDTSILYNISLCKTLPTKQAQFIVLFSPMPTWLLTTETTLHSSFPGCEIT